MAKSDALFDRNQLLFNLSVPLSALKMVRRPMPPQAIHIEKVDGKYTSHSHGNRHHQQQQQQHHHRRRQQGNGSDIAELWWQQQQQSFLLADSVTSEIFGQALTLARLDFNQRKRGDDVTDTERPAKNSKSSDTKLLTAKTTAAKSTMTPKTISATATTTNTTSNKGATQGVRVIERSSSATVKNASVQVSRKNTNQLCQNARSPEPTPLSHLPATTNSPPTRDNHDCTKQKFQRIHKDITNCLTDLQTILSSFIKEGLNESVENEQEVRSSNQDFTIVKVVSRKLYSIKQQAQDLKKQVDHMQKSKGQLLVQQQHKDMKYLSNRLSSIFQGIHRIFLDMCRYLKKEPTYTMSPNMIFVCVVHLGHMLNVLSLLIDIWSEMTHICSKANNSDSVDSLHEMITNTKVLCSQFQCENKPPPQANLFNKLNQRPNFTTQFSKRPDKDRNKMKATTSRAVSAKAKTSLKSGPSRSFPSQKTSVIYPAELQLHRKAFPASGRHKPSVVRQLDLQGPCTSPPQGNTSKLNACSKQSTNVPSGQPDLFDNQRIRQMFHQIAQASSQEDLPKSEAPKSGVVDYSCSIEGKNGKNPAAQFLAGPRTKTTAQPNGPTLTKGYPLRESAIQAGPLGKEQASAPAGEDGGADSSETLLQAFLGMSSFEKMITRLQEIEEEQLKIRHTWSNHVYPVASLQKPSALTNGFQFGAEDLTSKQTQGYHQRNTSPKSIIFTKEEAKSTNQSQPVPSYRCCNAQITAGYGNAFCPAAEAMTAAATATAASTQTRLFLQKHTLDAVKKNRAAYLLYLKKSAYHQVENFDPWELTEKIADAITTDCVADILGELQQLSDDIIQQIYEDEFAGVPPSEL